MHCIINKATFIYDPVMFKMLRVFLNQRDVSKAVAAAAAGRPAAMSRWRVKGAARRAARAAMSLATCELQVNMLLYP